MSAINKCLRGTGGCTCPSLCATGKAEQAGAASPAQGAASAPDCPACKGERGEEVAYSSTNYGWRECSTCKGTGISASAPNIGRIPGMAPILAGLSVSATDQGAAVAYISPDNLQALKAGCSPVAIYSPDCKRDGDIALAERAQAAQPTKPKGWNVQHVGEAIHITSPEGRWTGFMPSISPAHALTYKFLSSLIATPAPEQEAAPNELAEIERRAKAIYEMLPGSEAHPWVERGNSHMQDKARGLAIATRHLPAPAVEQEAAQAVAKAELAHGHREDYYLMANARRVALNPIHEIRAMPNWVFAKQLFATGSTSAHQICHDAGIDPDGYNVTRATATNTNQPEGDAWVPSGWHRADQPWHAYPVGTKARESWGAGFWVKTEHGWKWHLGSTFPTPGGADEVLYQPENLGATNTNKGGDRG